MQIYIIPTYECNMNCTSCYAKKFQKTFPDYLSWKDFMNIYDMFKNKANKFVFIGGEATRWKFINEAIMYLQNKGKTVTLLSNGTEIIDVMPNSVIINGSNLFDKKYASKILKNINLYKKKGVNTVLRYNVGTEFLDKKEEAINLAIENVNAVSLSVLYPVQKNDNEIGNAIYQIAFKLINSGIRVKISRATPLCLFTIEQKAFLERECGLSGRCNLPTNSFVVNPDGKTVQPCVELPMYNSIKEIQKSSSKVLFEEEIQCRITQACEECKECELFKNKECCGGCLAYKSN